MSAFLKIQYFCVCVYRDIQDDQCSVAPWHGGVSGPWCTMWQTVACSVSGSEQTAEGHGEVPHQPSHTQRGTGQC